MIVCWNNGSRPRWKVESFLRLVFTRKVACRGNRYLDEIRARIFFIRLFIYSFYIDRSMKKFPLRSIFLFFFFSPGTKYIRNWNFNRSNINSCWSSCCGSRWAVILRSKSDRVKFSFARGDRGIQIFEITELYSYILWIKRNR